MSIKKYRSSRIKKLLRVNEKELEPYYQWYLGEIEYEHLTPLQQEKFERFSKIWSYYRMGRTKDMIISAIMKEYDIQKRQVEYDISSSIQLHGRLDQVDKDGRRVASREFFDMLAQLALKDKNYDVAVKARKEADILAEIHEDQDAGHDPEKFTKPTKVAFIVNVHNGPASNEQSSNVIVLDE